MERPQRGVMRPGATRSYFLRPPLSASMSACIRRLCSAAQSPAIDALGAAFAGNILAGPAPAATVGAAGVAGAVDVAGAVRAGALLNFSVFRPAVRSSASLIYDLFSVAVLNALIVDGLRPRCSYSINREKRPAAR